MYLDLTRKLFDNYIRNSTYTDLEDVQSRIDYYVARNVITAAEACEYAEIARNRVCAPVTPKSDGSYLTRMENLEKQVAELRAALAEKIAAS